MLLEEKFLEFHRYASSYNLPLEAISVGDENKVLCEMHYADYTSVAYWYQTLPSAPLKPLPTDAEMCMR